MKPRNAERTRVRAFGLASRLSRVAVGACGQFASARVLARSRESSPPSRSLDEMKAIGAICDKAAVRYTVVAHDAVPIDVEVAVPASKVARGEQLNWLLEELEDLLRKTSPDAV